MSASKSITTAACTAFAAQLRREAEKVGNPDPGNQDHQPFHKRYAPSDEAVRKLVQRKRIELVEALGPNATDAEIAEARAKGPAHALREMRWRVKRAAKTFHDDLEAERRRRARHDNQVRPIRKQIEARRRAMPPGVRIDDALAKLSIISTGPTASLSERVSTGETDTQAPPFVGDPAAKARQIADDAAKAVERELEKARQARVDTIAA